MTLVTYSCVAGTSIILASCYCFGRVRPWHGSKGPAQSRMTVSVAERAMSMGLSPLDHVTV